VSSLFERVMKYRDIVLPANVDLPLGPIANIRARAHHHPGFSLGLFNNLGEVGKHDSGAIPIVGLAVEDMKMVMFHARGPAGPLNSGKRAHYR
jgi:hypothetical protein